jgi:flavin-dependent dehydrogenase
VYDNFLLEKAQRAGEQFFVNTEVDYIEYTDNTFKITAGSDTMTSDIVIGSFGKRSRLDVAGKRNFTKKRSPYVGVKYHIRTDHPDDLIGLHNFQGGYCGISKVENGVTNLCYLVHRDILKKHKGIREMEEAELHQNPFLKKIFSNAEFLFEKPETINEISFETKEPVWNHMLLSGDAAGMIAPLCGNGMAMAIHSANILSRILVNHLRRDSFARHELENDYFRAWNKHFSRRLWFGRIIQNKLFGTEWSSNLAVSLAVHSSFIANQIIKNTHGKPF